METQTPETKLSFEELCKSLDLDHTNIPDIRSFEDACIALNIKTELPIVEMLPEKHQKAIIAHYKLIIIDQALNQGWEPNWNNYDEWKFYPWMEIEADDENPSGVGFSYHACDHSYSRTAVGSRLCFKNRTLAKYAGKQFTELYKDYFLIG